MQYEYSPMQLAEITDFSFLKEWDTIRIMPEGYNEEEEREEQGDTMFRDLTQEETAQFQEHARNNLPGTADWSLFHPVCRAVWWDLACEHDGFDPKASFVVFSDDNPYIAEETP